MVVEAMRVSGAALVKACLDPDPSKRSKGWLGLAVFSHEKSIKALKKKGVSHFVVGVGGVGDNRPRRRLFERAVKAGLLPLSVQHPSAVVSPSARLGAGCQVMAGCIVNAGAKIGRNSIVNAGAIVEHDCRLGDHVHVASGAVLCGSVSVGDEAHIGAGAVVLQGVSVGKSSLVGAGAVVVRSVPSQTVVKGVPARASRKRE